MSTLLHSFESSASFLQNQKTSIRLQKWFTKTGQRISVTGKIHCYLYYQSSTSKCLFPSLSRTHTTHSLSLFLCFSLVFLRAGSKILKITSWCQPWICVQFCDPCTCSNRSNILGVYFVQQSHIFTIHMLDCVIFVILHNVHIFSFHVLDCVIFVILCNVHHCQH